MSHPASQRQQQDDPREDDPHVDEGQDAWLLTPAEALQQAIDQGAPEEVLRVLKRNVKRTQSSSERAVDHFEFSEEEADYRRADMPLGRVLSEHEVAHILASTLNAMVPSRPSAKSVSAILQQYFDMHPTLPALMRSELKHEALMLLASAAPEQLRMSWDALSSVSKAVNARPISDDEVAFLALGLPPIKRAKRPALIPLVHALAGSGHPAAPRVLAALHEAGVPVDAKRHGKRPIERAWAANASQTVALLTKLGKGSEPKQPKRPKKKRFEPWPRPFEAWPMPSPTEPQKSPSDSTNPLTRVPFALALLFAWLLSWAGHTFGFPVLAAVLPMPLLMLHKVGTIRQLRAGEVAWMAVLSLGVSMLIYSLQKSLGGAASIVAIALASGLYVRHR